MKIRLFFVLLAVVVICLPRVGNAEFYRYRDANGVLRFTDNLAEVPKDQRPGAQRYETFKSAPPAAAAVDSSKAGESEPENSTQAPKQAAAEGDSLSDTEKSVKVRREPRFYRI